MKAQGSASQQCLLVLFLLFLLLLEFDIAVKSIIFLHRTWNLGNLSFPLLVAFEGLPENWGSEALWQSLPIIREHTDMKVQKLSVLCLLYHLRIHVVHVVHVILQFITALQKLQKAELALCGKVLQLSHGLNIRLHTGKEWQKNIPFWKSQPVQAVTQCRTGVNWPSRIHSYLYLLWHGNKW